MQEHSELTNESIAKILVRASSKYQLVVATTPEVAASRGHFL